MLALAGPGVPAATPVDRVVAELAQAPLQRAHRELVGREAGKDDHRVAVPARQMVNRATMVFDVLAQRTPRFGDQQAQRRCVRGQQGPRKGV
jgi:hypothetical protein